MLAAVTVTQERQLTVF